VVVVMVLCMNQSPCVGLTSLCLAVVHLLCTVSIYIIFLLMLVTLGCICVRGNCTWLLNAIINCIRIMQLLLLGNRIRILRLLIAIRIVIVIIK
jgi:hypothetical protein